MPFINLLSSRLISGSCSEHFQLMPFLQVYSSCDTDKDKCVHASRRPSDKSYWLAVDTQTDFTRPPMTNLTEIQGHISRCRVCVGTSYILAKHSFTNKAPDCPTNFHSLWTGYSHLMVSLCADGLLLLSVIALSMYHKFFPQLLRQYQYRTIMPETVAGIIGKLDLYHQPKFQ